MVSNKLTNFFVSNKKQLIHILLCVFGSFVLAFGTAGFLIPANIVAGGTSGIGIILNYYLEPILHTRVEDIIVWTINIILLIISFFFVGKKFAFHTLVSTICFPLFLTLMLRTPMIAGITEFFKDGSSWWQQYPNLEALRLLFAGLFAGLTIGIGVSLTFIGGGSTGGLDVIYFLLFKYFHIKQSISSFVLDFITILLYALLIPGNIINSLIGVLSALSSAFVIEIMYIKLNYNYVIDIVTKKYEEINKYVINDLKKTTTMILASGAYSKNKFQVLRLVVSRRDFKEVYSHLKDIDPKAFVTIIEARKVYGNGFSNIGKKDK